MNVVELHKQGTAFLTRDQRPVRILCTSRRSADGMQIVGLISFRETGTEHTELWNLNGQAQSGPHHDLISTQALPKGPEHWASLNPGAADQYRCEARAARDALGFGKDDPNVAPVDLRTAVKALKATSGGVEAMTLRAALHARPSANDHNLLAEYTHWLAEHVEPAMRGSREAVQAMETTLRQEGYTAAMVVALTHVQPESDSYWALVKAVGGMERLWDAAARLGADIYDYSILPPTEEGTVTDA